jgi:hypothetical protein
MTHTPPTSTTASPRDDARPPQPSRPTFGEMIEELIDLSVGVGVMLLPMLLLAVPAIVLFVALPAIVLLVLAAPLAVIGAAIVAPPYLLARWLRRRRHQTSARPAGLAHSAVGDESPQGFSPVRTGINGP